ncbi:MAG TPA: TonB-dependent receptor [Chitinophagaceae bacterium]|nr:TonB-dependent receptor [Chitinophagaceae bacterium]
MKKSAMILLVLLTGFHLFAQSEKHKLNDSTVSFIVNGACEMCKERIETALNIRGIKSANWDIDSKVLNLEYNTSIITLAKIHRRIAEVGHDTRLEKAKDAVYNDLPVCCHYRELDKKEAEKEMEKYKALLADPSPEKKDSLSSPAVQHRVKGVVLEEDKKDGSFKPLSSATVQWMGTNTGVLTDSSGVFIINHDGKSERLIISYAGYSPDTLSITEINELKIILATDKQLSEVKVTSKQRSTYLSAMNPIRTQIMTEKELFKAACCNLSESFETNPSVDVSYNDAVTGSKQIQLLGLSGNYTQLTVENLPGPRGLAMALGLNSIAGPWVESIQLNKGVGSVANGFESIAGQINIELKKPEKAEKLYLNAYLNDMDKADLNFNLSQKFGKKWSAALLLHDDFLLNKTIDFNKDGFRDLPTGNLFSAMNRWKFDDGKGFLTQFGFKLLIDDRTGGEKTFDPDKDKFTTHHYGLGINTKRYEGFAKVGYVFPNKKFKSIGLQLSAFKHQQDSYFGLTEYDAEQHNFYANLIYQSIIGSTKHKFRTGFSLVSDRYDEKFNSTEYKRTETVPGTFFEYTFTPVEKFNLVAGLRTDHNSIAGWFITPRLHIRYEPIKGTTIRLSMGRGQRTANIFAENASVFVSSRQINILSASTGKAYGLDQEVAWNKGISLDQKIRLFHRDGLISLDYFRNDFDNQVVVDLEDARLVKFYNLQGKSCSNSFQAELNIEPALNFEVRLAYRLFDVKSTYGNLLLQKPFTAKHRAFANLAYETSGWKLDYTINLNGSKRIPNTSGNPVQYQRSATSPSYVLMNAQVSKTIGKKHPFELYAGGENLTNFFQKDVIIAAGQPFSNYFDASLVWGPVSGRLFYLGWRYKLK